jgi:DNA-binding LacI/PurR family transcriptional regulator
MADVARAAGVSHQTVSRVVNGSEAVRPETRERVRRAMAELDYRPNSLARALVTGRSWTLGVVSFDTTLYGPASTLFGIERAAHAAGYFVSIVSVTSLDRASVRGAVEQLRAQGVDGILIITPQDAAVEAVLHTPADMPLVAVEAGPEQAVPVVAVDQVAGARAATQHLLDLGHRTVWHVAGPEDWLEARQRREGWMATLEAAGVDVPPLLTGDWSAQSGYELGRRLATVREVTAIFAANDQMALGILRALYEAGREVPRDLSLVGFDDIPEARFFTPPLTTVQQDFGEVGRQSLMLLLTEIATSERSSAHVVVAPKLQIRDSTAPPRG